MSRAAPASPAAFTGITYTADNHPAAPNPLVWVAEPGIVSPRSVSGFVRLFSAGFHVVAGGGTGAAPPAAVSPGRARRISV
jgi:hypothetical protein